MLHFEVLEQFEKFEKFGMPPKEERQTMLFSATLPEDLQKLAMSLIRSWSDSPEDRLQFDALLLDRPTP